MSIAFACEGCGKKYEVSESLAGKKGRCKQCGHEFRIPTPGAPTEDFYGLEEMAESAAAAEPVATAPLPKRRGFAPAAPAPKSSAAKRSAPADSANKEQFRRTGTWMMVAGVGVFVLPFVGLQIRGINHLPVEVQAGAGVLLVIIGGGLLILSVAKRPMRALGIGIGSVLGLLVLFLVFGSMVSRGRHRPPPAHGFVPPKVGGQPARPVPSSIPNGTGGFAGGAQPGNGLQAENAIHVTLTNAKAAREASPGVLIREVSFSSDYQLAPGASQARPVTWVIESSKSNATMDGVHLNSSGGHLSGTLSVTNGDTGPFHCYLGIRNFGPGGATYAKISNTVTMQWMGDNGLEPENAKPERPGMPPGFPGRPPFGPRGPRGRP